MVDQSIGLRKTSDGAFDTLILGIIQSIVIRQLLLSESNFSHTIISLHTYEAKDRERNRIYGGGDDLLGGGSSELFHQNNWVETDFGFLLELKDTGYASSRPKASR